MAKQYRTREGEATAVDTKTQLTTVGSESAPGPLLVPASAKVLLGVHIASCSNFAATGRASGIVRLEGPGLPGGPEVITAGAFGVTVATGGQSAITPVYIPLNVPVTASNEILVFAEMTGADIGQVSFGVTLVFQT